MSKSDSGPTGRPVTVDELIALNDEMVALVRAGVPLERGLVQAGGELKGRLGTIVRDLGGRLGEGERLPEALARSGHAMPDLYRAVIEAGLRSGRLASALEGMATVARGYAEARRALGLALMYPLLVTILAYGLALAFVVEIAPRFVTAFESLGLRPLGSLEAIARAGETANYWGPIAPILLFLLAIRWSLSGRSLALDSDSAGGWSGRIPMIGPMIASFRDANYAELLALLIEHRVPLDEAVRLSGQASGDRELRKASLELSESLRRGEGTEVGHPIEVRSMPPLMGWMISAGHRQGELPSSLRHLAKNYRRKAQDRAEVIRAALPTFLMLVIGAVTVFLYGLLLFVPMTTLYNELALPTP